MQFVPDSFVQHVRHVRSVTPEQAFMWFEAARAERGYRPKQTAPAMLEMWVRLGPIEASGLVQSLSPVELEALMARLCSELHARSARA